MKGKASWKSNCLKGEERELTSETEKPNSPSGGFGFTTRSEVSRWRWNSRNFEPLEDPPCHTQRLIFTTRLTSSLEGTWGFGCRQEKSSRTRIVIQPPEMSSKGCDQTALVTRAQFNARPCSKKHANQISFVSVRNQPSTDNVQVLFERVMANEKRD